MSKTVISVENLTKQYDLGLIGTGTLSRDLNRWWARLRGQPDPYTRIGQEDSFNRRNESILALDNVSFTVQQGEALGIIGKNGAGKSTLLKILSRVTAPTSGVVKIRGRIGSLLEVGTGFHPELTGRENIFLNGAILGMRKDEVQRKFDEIVEFSGVEKFIDTPVKRYSSGMYVRLAFAVAAHLDPEILVVDEVLAVGDAEFQKKCLGKMGDVAGEGRTVLFVSHNMGAIKHLCKRGILLDTGKIKYKGDALQCISTYLENYSLGDDKTIKSHISKQSQIITINDLLANDKPNDNVDISSKIHQLVIDIMGTVKLRICMDLEIRVKDTFGTVLALYSPGHMKGYGKTFDQGSFHLRRIVKFPKNMTKGVYILDLSLTDTNKISWVDIPDAIKVSYEGFSTETGRIIDYSSNSGWLILNDNDE